MAQLDAPPKDDDAPRLPGPRSSLGDIAFGLALGIVSTGMLFVGAASGAGQINPLTLLEGSSAAQGEESDAEPSPPPRDVAYIDLPLAVYEIRRTDRQNYLSAQIALKVPSAQAERVEAALPELSDTIQAYVRHLEPSTLQGAAGLYDLRRALLHRTRFLLGPEAVDAVLITDLLIG